jgi:hypothetical protein
MQSEQEYDPFVRQTRHHIDIPQRVVPVDSMWCRPTQKQWNEWLVNTRHSDNEHVHDQASRQAPMSTMDEFNVLSSFSGNDSLHLTLLAKVICPSFSFIDVTVGRFVPKRNYIGDE